MAKKEPLTVKAIRNILPIGRDKAATLRRQFLDSTNYPFPTLDQFENWLETPINA